MAERVIAVEFKDAAPGKYRVNLTTGKWGPVLEALITTDNIQGPSYPSIPFGYFMREKPAYSINGEYLGTPESQLVLLPDRAKAIKRLFFNGKHIRDIDLDYKFKPTTEFLDVILLDESSLGSDRDT